MSSSSTVPITQSSIQHSNPFTLLPTSETDTLAYREPETTSVSTTGISTPVTSLTTSSLTSPSSPRMAMTIKTPAMMPACGEKGAPPKFKGSYEEVKRFLQRYNDITTTYNASSTQKCERVIDYCSPKVRRLVESLRSYIRKDWDTLQQDFLKYYDASRRDTRYIIRDLQQLVKDWKHRSIKNLTHWRQYERKFMTIAGWLHAKKKIGDEEQSAYFWHGINKKLKNLIENRLLMKDPSPSVTQAFPMSSVISIAEELFERDRFDFNLADSDTDLPDWNGLSSDTSSDEDSSSDSEQESYQRHSHTKKKIKKKSKIDDHSDSDGHGRRNRFSRGLSSSKTARMPLESLKHKDQKKADVKGKPPLSKHTNMPFQQQSDVEQLIKQLGRMSLDDPQYSLTYYKAIKLDPTVVQCVSPPSLQRSQPSRNQAANSNAAKPGINSGNQLRGSNRPPLTCYGCGEAGHGLRDCPHIIDLINRGVVSRDRFGKIVFRDGTPVQRGMGETIVQAANRRQIAQTNFVEISNLSEYYQSDSEDQEMDVMVAEKGPKLITKTRKAVFDGVAVPRSTWKGKENTIPSQPQARPLGNRNGPFTRSQGPPMPSETASPSIASKGPQQIVQVPVDVRQPRQTEIPDVEMRDISSKKPFPNDKSIPRAKVQSRQSQVSSQVGQFQVVNSILNTPVTLKVGEVLATSKELTEQLASMIRLKNIKQPAVPSQTLYSADDRALLIKIPLECDGRQVSAIIDTGSQLNVVSKNISEKIIKRPVNSYFTATMKDANGGAGKLEGKIDNVPLRCGGVLTKATLFVGQQLPFDLLLGRPWQKNNLVSIEERPNGTYVVFRSHKKPNFKHELLVEDHVPRPDYSFGDSWPEELVDDEFWPTELIDRDEVNVAVVTVEDPIEVTRRRLQEIRGRAIAEHLAAVKSEFEIGQGSADHPLGWGLGQDLVDYGTTHGQTYTNSPISSWKTMENPNPKHATMDRSNPKYATMDRSSPKHATMERTNPNHGTIDGSPNWATMGEHNPNRTTMDRSIPNSQTMDNSVPLSKSSPILTTMAKFRFRPSIVPLKEKLHGLTGQKYTAISKKWDKICSHFHSSLPVPTSMSQTGSPNQTYEFLQHIPLVYQPNNISPPDPIATHDPLMGRGDQYRRVVSLDHLIDLVEHNDGINAASGMITSPQAVRYEVQQVSNWEVEHGAFLHASLIHMDHDSIPSIRHGHLYYTFVKDPRMLISSEISVPIIVPPPSLANSTLSTGAATPTAMSQDIPTVGESSEGATLEQGDHSTPHFHVMATLAEPLLPTNVLGDAHPYIPPIFLNSKPYADQSKDGVNDSPPLPDTSTTSGTSAKPAEGGKQKFTVRQMGIYLGSSKDKGKDPEVPSSLLQSGLAEPDTLDTPLGSNTGVYTPSSFNPLHPTPTTTFSAVHIRPPVYNHDPTVKDAQTAIRTGGEPPLSCLRIPKYGWGEEPKTPSSLHLRNSVTFTPKAPVVIPPGFLETFFEEPVQESPVEMQSPGELPLLEEPLEGLDHLKVFPSSASSEDQLKPETCNPQDILPDSPSQGAAAIMEHPPITTLEDSSQPAPSTKRRWTAGETEDLEEGECVELVEIQSRHKRQRSETSQSSTDGDSESHHNAPDEWDVPPTTHEDWNAGIEEVLKEQAWEEASDSGSDLSISSSDIEKEWEEFQDELAKALNASNASSSPPPLVPVESSSEEQSMVSPKTFDPKDFEFLMASPKQPARPPSRDTPFISAWFPPSHTFFYPPDQLWYEVITDQIDGWEYSDATTYVPRPHGSHPEAPAIWKFWAPPRGHPVWCEANNVPIIRFHTSRVFIGQHDNHPLQKWENHITPGVTSPHSIPDKFDLMAIPFQQAYSILGSTTLTSDDWNQIPESVYRDEVQESVRLHQAYYNAVGPSQSRLPFGNQLELSKRHMLLGCLPPASSNEPKGESPSTWERYPMGAPSYSSLITSFANPYVHLDKDIAFNAWNPLIAELRKARAYVLRGIRMITLYFLQPNLRKLIDLYSDDTKHYFYHHCHIFRLMDVTVDPLQQGFTCKCIHVDHESTLFPSPVREPFSTHNPIISEEEDEFLHHASKIFDHLEKHHLTKQVRLVREVNPFMADRISLLFKSGHLDMFKQFDEDGNKWPLLWHRGELKL